MSTYFDHERLDVYKASLEFVIASDRIVKSLPRGRGYLQDQLQRACSSITLNIAEGAGEFSRSEKRRFYRMAKRSATECAGILDICLSLNILSTELHQQGRTMLLRIVGMLVKMVIS